MPKTGATMLRWDFPALPTITSAARPVVAGAASSNSHRQSECGRRPDEAGDKQARRGRLCGLRTLCRAGCKAATLLLKPVPRKGQGAQSEGPLGRLYRSATEPQKISK